MDNEIIVKSIKDLCKKRGITANQLENNVGLSQGLISRWLNTTPSLDKIVDIADYFQVSLDEVVGYNQNINDEFLLILIKMTEEKIIQWHEVEKDNKLVKRISSNEIYDDELYTELQYYTKYKDSYFSIYCFCKYNNTMNPNELGIYIQPSNDTNPVYQQYTTEDLKSLWIKVLKNLDNNVPDDVKAEDLKMSFINEFSNKKSQQSKKKIIFEPDTHNNQVLQIMKHKGCLIYDLNSNIIIDSNEATGVTHIAKEFYYKHKETLGKVKQAHLKNGEDLVFVSENYLMKLSGFSWGRDCGATGFNGLLEVLNDAGFEVNQFTNFDGEDFTLLSPIK